MSHCFSHFDMPIKCSSQCCQNCICQVSISLHSKIINSFSWIMFLFYFAYLFWPHSPEFLTHTRVYFRLWQQPPRDCAPLQRRAIRQFVGLREFRLLILLLLAFINVMYIRGLSTKASLFCFLFFFLFFVFCFVFCFVFVLFFVLFWLFRYYNDMICVMKLRKRREG